jgi:hypothetical protein
LFFGQVCAPVPAQLKGKYKRFCIKDNFAILSFFDFRVFPHSVALLNILVLKSSESCYSGRGKFMPLPLKSKLLENPGSLVPDDIKMFPLLR